MKAHGGGINRARQKRNRKNTNDSNKGRQSYKLSVHNEENKEETVHLHTLGVDTGLPLKNPKKHTHGYSENILDSTNSNQNNRVTSPGGTIISLSPIPQEDEQLEEVLRQRSSMKLSELRRGSSHSRYVSAPPTVLAESIAALSAKDLNAHKRWKAKWLRSMSPKPTELDLLDDQVARIVQKRVCVRQHYTTKQLCFLFVVFFWVLNIRHF